MKRSENFAKEKPFLSSAFRRLHAVSHILQGYPHTSRIQEWILFSEGICIFVALQPEADFKKCEGAHAVFR